MSTFGLFGLVIAFAGVAIGSVCLLASQALRGTRRASSADTFAWAGAVAHILAFVALTFCCGLLVFCFMTGDFSIEYVLLEHSEAEGALGVLYRFAGLWAGREGSLLLWAWLISAFNVAVAVRVMKHDEPIDCMALLVSGLVLVAFVAVMLFSESNMPFTATAAPYIDSSGRLTNTGSMQGMNPLLEHWAQAIHPPTLFIGYAGLTIPFAYAIAALIANDPSKKWVERSSRFAMISWLFLGIGIGLGCVWAYVVLGWGGYWGWDAVENASLLSWCVALALVHSFTVYRKRGAFKRWSIMCACITFAFVITGTFITRSGIVQSVHAFEGDPVSLVLFGGLIAVSMLVGALGLFIRWKSFCPGENDVMESFASRDAAYYFNNVIMIVFTVILCYLTVASALPSWLPFGGQSLSAGTYNAIARPLGVVYCAIIAVCPLLSWVKTDPKTFWKKARIPALCAVVLFVGLMSYFATTLYPAYDAIIQAGGTEAEELASEGPVWYYNGIAVVGFASKSGYGDNTELLSIAGSNSGSVGVAYHSITDQNLKDVLQEVDTSAGQTMVSTAIGALAASGATRTDLGLDMAQRILSANPVQPNEKRNRVVIVFTDGAPTSFNGFEKDVADNAITYAGTIKTTGATVYTIGIFAGADATSAGTEPSGDLDQNSRSLNSACNWFMQQVSSNNGTPCTPSYYLSAADAGSLSSIFQQISDNIETGGSSSTLTEGSVVRDIISPQFTLPAGSTASDITLETYACTGKDGDTYTWRQNDTAMGATAAIDGNNVSVTGFDFSENYVGTVTNHGSVSYRGHKLVIRFSVKPQPGFLGGNNVPTNAGAGVYENKDSETPVREFPQPARHRCSAGL